MKNMLHAQKLPLVLSFALLAGLATQSIAQTTVFSDDFTDNDRAGWYIFNKGVDAAERTLDTSGGFMKTVSSGDFASWGAVANFSNVSLSAAGEYIELSLKFRIFEDIGSNTITVGLFNSEGTSFTADNTVPGTTSDDSGYYMYNKSTENAVVVGKGTGLAQVNGTNRRGKITDTLLLAPYVTASETWHNYTLTLTYNANGTISATQQVGTLNQQGHTWAIADSTYSFDEIAFQALRQDFAIDDVVITTTGTIIPEPSSFALLAGMLALTSVMVRRRG